MLCYLALYLTLLHSIVALLHFTWPYITLPWLYFTLLDSTLLIHASTSFYLTLLHSTMALLHSTIGSTLLYHDFTSLCLLPWRPAPDSLSQTVVRASLKGLKHPELLSNHPEHQIPSVKRWFEQVRRGWTTPNWCQTTLYTRFPQSNGGSSWFGGVENPKFMSNYPVHQVPSVKRWFEGVEQPPTHVKHPVSSVKQWFE